MMFSPLQTLPVLLTAVIILNCLYSTAISCPPSRGAPETPQCSQGLPPPDQPFRVVWNHPDNCEWKGHPLNLSDYGIIHNSGRIFIGDEIQTLYNTGTWPMYSGNKPINGGLPQLVNDTTFAATRAALGRYRVANFRGLGVLDFESWRPTFYTNFGSMRVYQTESKNLVKLRHPEYNKTMVEKLAQAEWNAAARRIMSAKLAVAQELMPGGHWGYYLHPRTWSEPGPNNKIAWLWQQATGLYPSIYLYNPNQSTTQKQNRVSREMAEAVRIQNTYSSPNTPIYPYSNIQQGSNIFFQQDHLRVTLGLPADMGASGIVLWGSSFYYRARGQCQRLQQYVRQVLGPYVRNLTQFMSDCSAALCAGHGRCVNNKQDVLLNVSVALSLSAQCTSRDSRFHDYHCRCYSPWTGACCQTYNPLLCQPAQAAASSQKGRVSGGTMA